MAKPKEHEIEQCIRRVVRDAKKSGDETFTPNVARSRVETKLGLDAGFLKSDADWKQKSKAIIQATFDEEEESAELVAPTPIGTARPRSTGSAKKATDKTTPQKRSKKAEHGTKEAPATGVKQSTATVDARASQKNEGDATGGSKTSKAQGQPQLKRPDKTPSNVNGVKRKSAERSSSAGSSEDDGGDESQQKKAKVDSSSTSEEASEESSDGESESESSEDAKDQSKSEEPPAQTTVKRIHAKPFKPPPGYIALDPGLLANNMALTSDSLNGKQVWHITAPSDVPLSSITELALDAIPSNELVLSHNGINYILNEDQTKSHDTVTLLLPTNDGYQKAPHNVHCRLNLQRRITLPNLTMLQASQVTGSSAAGEVAQASVNTIRPQPKGLRMRYRPSGFGAGDPGRIGSGSESTDEEEPSSARLSFQFPKTLRAYETSAQRNEDTEIQHADTEKAAKKSKKKRKDKGDAEKALTKVNGVPAGSSTSPPAPGAGSAMPNGNATERERKEDKAKRKEEKRLAKEARKKAKAASG